MAVSAQLETRPPWARGLRLHTLAELAVQEAALPHFPIGWQEIDEALGGGLPCGALTECSAPVDSCGLTLLQHQLLTVTRERRQFIALVDAFDRFDPASSDPALLENLLWVRGEGAAQAMKAVDILVRDNNFGIILLDLRDAPARALRRIPAQHWYRLQRAARESDAILIAFTPFPTVASARVRLEFSPWGRHPATVPLDDLPRSELVRQLRWTPRFHGMRKAE